MSAALEHVFLADEKGRPQPLLPSQDALLSSNASLRCFFGSWGSGKTLAGALALLQLCAENPYHESYGEDRPTALITSITTSVIRDSALKALLTLLPPEAISKIWKAEKRLRLANGVDIIWRSISGALEGLNAFAVWADEAHLCPSHVWPNIQSRCRDVTAKALGRNLGVIVTGLPLEGWLRATFDAPEHANDPDRFVVMGSVQDNHYLPDFVVKQLRASVGTKDAEALIHGRWRSPEGAIYYAYSTALHLKDDAGDKNTACHFSVDVGSQAVGIVLQPRVFMCKDKDGKDFKKQGLHVVDFVETDAMGTDDLVRLMLARGWTLRPGHSKVFIDPRSGFDTIAAVQRAIPRDVHVLRNQEGEPAYDREYGYRCVNAALLDTDRNVALTFYRGLPNSKRSILTAMPAFRRKPSGIPHKDNTTDHAADALRYPVANLMPPIAQKIETVRYR